MGKKRNRKSGNSSNDNFHSSSPKQGVSKRQRPESVLSENLYEVLSEQEHTAVNVSGKQISVATQNDTVVNNSNLDGFGEVPDEQRQPTIKIPPLMVKSMCLADLKSSLGACQVTATYKICRIGIKVVLPTIENYLTAKQFLDTNNAEYYTFDIPSEKPFKAVIRGLPIMNVEEIKSDLEDRYKLKPLAVFPMSRHNRMMEFRDCLYLVHFPKGSVTLGALKAARVIQNIIVAWEGYRGANKDVTQCMRCLNFGHGTRNCRLKARCNICTLGHITDSCPSKDADDIEIKCVNCGGSHRSTDRACPKRNEYKNIRKQACSTNQPSRRRDRAPPPDLGDFPPIDSGNIQPVPQPRWHIPPPSQTQGVRIIPPGPPPGFQKPISYRENAPHENRSTDATPLLYTAADLQRILNEMCDKLQQCSSRLEQVRLIGNLVLTYGY